MLGRQPLAPRARRACWTPAWHDTGGAARVPEGGLLPAVLSAHWLWDAVRTSTVGFSGHCDPQ